jgi:hypothetical protein
MRTHREHADESFDLELPGGRDVTVEFVRTLEWHRENYGADADGNRGVMTSMVDSDEASRVTVDFGDGVLVPLAEIGDADRAAVDAAIGRYLEDYEFEANEGPDEPDPDRDRDDV